MQPSQEVREIFSCPVLPWTWQNVAAAQKQQTSRAVAEQIQLSTSLLPSPCQHISMETNCCLQRELPAHSFILIPVQSWSGIKAAVCSQPCVSTLGNASLSHTGGICPRRAENRVEAAATASSRGRQLRGFHQAGSEHGIMARAGQGSLRSDRFLPAIVPPIRNQTRGLSPFGGKPGRRYCTMIKGFERTKGIVRLFKLSDTHQGGRLSGQAV